MVPILSLQPTNRQHVRALAQPRWKMTAHLNGVVDVTRRVGCPTGDGCSTVTSSRHKLPIDTDRISISSDIGLGVMIVQWNWALNGDIAVTRLQGWCDAGPDDYTVRVWVARGDAVREVQLRWLVGDCITFVASARNNGNADTKIGVTARWAVIVEVTVEGSASWQGPEKGQADGSKHVHSLPVMALKDSSYSHNGVLPYGTRY